MDQNLPVTMDQCDLFGAFHSQLPGPEEEKSPRELQFDNIPTLKKQYQIYALSEKPYDVRDCLKMAWFIKLSFISNFWKNSFQ